MIVRTAVRPARKVFMRKSTSVQGAVRLLIGANKLYGTDNMDKGEIQNAV